ncbi:hypothetical protein B296_00046579 [Ensete ventricosum]|uniref:Uncharacterized protein n=1 Tax=Ensete ventricosum TaxID=4639 RepID=A0A426XWD3_ENSVE|nr:hypothetical protein B296_00046579 [Ensete ventricosum]
MVSPNPRLERDRIIPATLVGNRGLLPTLSSRKVATRMKVVLVTPMPMVTNRSLLLLLIPAFLKILGV